MLVNTALYIVCSSMWQMLFSSSIGPQPQWHTALMYFTWSLWLVHAFGFCLLLCWYDRNACTIHYFLCLYRFHSMPLWRWTIMPFYSPKSWTILMWSELFSSPLCVSFHNFAYKFSDTMNNSEKTIASDGATRAHYLQIDFLSILQTSQDVISRLPIQKEWMF